MTTVAPRPTRSHHSHPRLLAAVGIALLIAGLTIGLLLAFSSGGTAGSSVEPTPPGIAPSVVEHPSTDPVCGSGPLQPKQPC